LVVGLGLINKDFVAVVPAWERDEKVTAVAYFEQVGGPVPVALTAMARLGLATSPVFLGVVGDDRDADDLARLLEADGVNANNLNRAEDIVTSRSLVFVDRRDGSRTLANYAENLPSLSFSPDSERLLSTARLLHLDGRDLSGGLWAAEIVRANGGTVSLDLGTMRPGREALISQCDIVLASRKGGAGAFPEAADDPVEQVRRFLAMGVRIAGVTRAHEGVVIGTAEMEPVHLPAYPVAKVVDTCGAGDMFHGAYLWAYLSKQGPVACADFAQAAVALRIQAMGNRAGQPTQAMVAAFQESVKKL
jgi:sugar/nucleoside kinase (ribokinase family)